MITTRYKYGTAPHECQLGQLLPALHHSVILWSCSTKMVNFIRALCLFLASSTSVVLSMTLKDYEAQNILDKGIKALGGKNALNALKGGSMHA